MKRAMLRASACLLLGGLAFPWSQVDANAPTAKAAKGDGKKQGKAVERSAAEILKLLNEPVKCSYSDMDIKAAIGDLGQQVGIRIKLDMAFLGQQSGDLDNLTVSLNVDGLPLKKALRKMVEVYHFSFGVVGDTLWVSTEEGLAARQVRQYISVDWQAKKFEDVIAELSQKYAVPLVIDPKSRLTKGKELITLVLEDSTLESVLRLISEMVGLKPVRIGNAFYISGEERVDRLRDSDSLAPPIPIVPERNQDNPGGQPAPLVPPNGNGNANENNNGNNENDR
jgi:hypothetical protein